MVNAEPIPFAVGDVLRLKNRIRAGASIGESCGWEPISASNASLVAVVSSCRGATSSGG